MGTRARAANKAALARAKELQVRLPSRRRLPLEWGSGITGDAKGRHDARRFNFGKARTEIQVWPDLLIAVDYEEAGAELVLAHVSEF